jgi:hypothetical protein
LFDFLSTRELAVLIWVAVVIIIMTLTPSLRKPFGGVIRALFVRQILLAIFFLITYVAGLITILKYFSFWDVSLLKDTIFWFFGFAIMTFFNINKAKQNHFFKVLLVESLKWTVLIEFLINFYTFKLIVELIAFPLLVFVVLIQAFSQNNAEHAAVSNVIAKLLSIIGAVYFAYALYRTIAEYQQFFTVQSVYALLLPVVLTILVIPFLYLLAVYVQYEELFVRTRFMANDAKKRRALKHAIIFTAKINLDKINIIAQRINKFDLYHSSNIRDYIDELLHK